MVVAACSPHLHEKTFRRACQNAGLNPYLCQMTNVREHVSWVTNDKAAGTEKAKALVSAAAERVKHQEPLEPMRVKVNPATLVIGGGIAGLQATLELADAGYPRLSGRTRAVDRRPHGPVRQDLPHAGLLGLHPHAEDVGSRPARERHHADLLRVGGGQRLGGQFQGEDSQEGPLRRSTRNAPAAASASKNARERSSTTCSRPAWAIARRSTRPSRRPCRARR